MSRNHKQEPDRGLVVTVVNNDVNRALRKLKKKVNNDGLLKELRERQYYEKPSAKRKKAKAAARKRWLKKAAGMELPSKSDRKY
jgi:small subunit ribosomal protein S21